MKKLFTVVMMLFAAAVVFAQENEESESQKKWPLWFDLVYTESASFNQITRIEVQEESSNFVRETFLAGANVNISTSGLWIFDLELQLGAYYPFKNAFNGMTQKSRNMFNYAIDGYFGAKYTFDKIKFVVIEASVGMHYMFQLTDEYYMDYVGLGTYDSFIFPITKNISVINSYFFSYDNPNLGSNAKVQPFDASYQYHIDLGIRVSRAVPNKYSYIH